MDTPEEIVTYVVAGVQEREGTLGKTKLVKLLYLIDIDLYARFRRTATGFPWRYYYFGPYANEIEDVLRRVDFDLQQEEVTTARGTTAVVFRPAGSLSYLLDRVQLSNVVRSAANGVLQEWALEELYTILDHVYFHTAPMANARPGQTLDFETIPRYEPARPLRRLEPIPPNALVKLRDALARATATRAQLEGMANDQRRRLYQERDARYAELMRRFESTEEKASRLEGVELNAPGWSDEA